MVNRRPYLRAALLGCLSALFIPVLEAAPITVANHSFENQVANLAPGGWTNQLVDWTGTNGSNSGDAFMEYIAGFAGEGTDHLGLALNYNVWQDLGISYQANAVYTLKVAVGNRNTSFSVAGNQSTYALADTSGTVYASASKDVSTQPASTFMDGPDVVLDTAQVPAAVGKPIRILLQARGAGRSHFDNVRLDGPADNRAVVATGAASGITNNAATLHGSVSAVGAGAPSIVFYYGTADGGTTKSSWTSSVAVPGTHSGAFSQAVSGLLPNTTYFFRALATNSAGESWSSPVRSFTTLGEPPSIALGSAHAITATSAKVTATVTGTGGVAPTVTIYYGTSDGGTAPAAWQQSRNLGTVGNQAEVQLSGLQKNTTYFFRAMAENPNGSAWTANTGSFRTLDASLATVINRPAADITHTGAELRGRVTSLGGDPPLAVIHWGTTDGGTDPAAWENAAPQGHQSNNFSERLQGLQPGRTYYYRASAANAAGTAWADSTASFTTPAASPPAVRTRTVSGLTATTASLRGEVTSTGGLPTSATIYWGPADGGTNAAAWAQSAPVGEASGDFSRFVSGLSPETTYFYRAAASNSAGSVWAASSQSFTTPPNRPVSVIINEIFYRRPSSDRSRPGPTTEFIPKTKAIEFIELHNPTAEAIDLSGWRFDDGVTYTFPAGTSLPAGGYLSVAQNPAHFQERFNTTALGPWSGRLATQGERIRLVNATGAVVDEVSYEAGFPWPTAARGGGESAERIHWSLDPNLGGSWRSSSYRPQQFIPLASGQWRWRKGTSEPSATGAWRQLNFTEDATWQTGQSPFGYVPFTPPQPNTVLSDMQGNYTSIYLRHTFTLSGDLPSRLSITANIDDGAVFWINGQEVARQGVPPGEPQFDTTANLAGNPSASRTFVIENADAVLQPGLNILAVHAFNATSNSNDFYIEADLKVPAPPAGSGNATPNRRNSAFSSLAPPAVRQVQHQPRSPAAGVPVTLTAKVTDPDGVASVTLKYQIVEPGSFIPRFLVTSASQRQENPAYENPANWQSVAMRDDGQNGDAVAGDSIYTAVLPAAVQQHRRLIRYRIETTDAHGTPSSIRVPYADDEQPNFAYFVYNGVPGWTGALRPTAFAGAPATQAQTFSPELLSSIEPYHLLARNVDVNNSQYSSSFNDVRFPGAFVYEGVVYDHIEFKNRGIGSTYVSGKNKWAIHFNRARDFQARDNWGRKYDEDWNSLFLDANAGPWAAVHRGSAGVEEAASYRIYELAGVPALKTHYVHLRVIDDAQEISPTSQYEGDFWGLYLSLEPMEGNFLDERGLPDGNIYSIEGNNGDKKNQSETQVADGSDWITFRNGVAQTGQSEAWYRANEDLPNLYTFMGLSRLIGNVDVRPGDNYRYYYRPTDNRWVILPYDLDMQFIAATHWGGSMDGMVVAGAPNSIRAMSRHEALAVEYRNRARELLSLMASDPTPSGGQIGQLIDEYADMVNPEGRPLTWADADAAMWNLHPRTNGSGANTGQTSHKGNFWRANYLDGTRGGLGGTVQTGSWVRTLPDPDRDGFGDHEGQMQWFVDYATNTYPQSAPPWVRKATNASGGGADPSADRQRGYGYKYLEWESHYGGYFNANVNPSTPPDLSYPGKPVISHAGAPGFPAGDLTFRSSAFTPSSQGGTTFAAMEWRLGEISAPGIPFYREGTPRTYEIEPLWSSGELTSFSETIRIPASAVRAGHTYRARVRHKDANGRWSLWSEPVQFIAGQADVSVLVQSLVISEVHYNPAPPSAAEAAAGYNNDDFEFIELKNISALPVDLTDVRFTKGIDFNFPAGRILPAGGFVLLVKNPAAFAMRYGNGLADLIAGSYGPDSLSNGGEQVKLSYGLGEPIRDFVYDDAAPWPEGADGQGYSLTLVNPDANPDHALASSWKASARIGGTPGADESGGGGVTFAQWTAGYPGLGGALDDDDRDGLVNLLEFALGGDPRANSADRLPTGSLAPFTVGGTTAQYLTLTLRRPSDRAGVTYEVEFSGDLRAWSGGAVLVSTETSGGVTTEVWRSSTPVTGSAPRFGRVRVR